jgi:MFS family permease
MQRRALGVSAENAKPGTEQEPRRRWAAIAALRHRNFRLFWGGQVISLIGTWMQTVAQGYLVYHLTHSAAMLGLVTTLASLPVLLLTLFGGVLADRLPKRRVLVGTQSSAAALALILGILVATGVVQVWHVMLLATALGIVNALDVPTRQAFVVELVGKRDLLNAIALNSSIFNGARIVGPAVAGLLIARTGLAAPFLLNAASYLAVIAGLLAMRLPPFMVEQNPAPALRRLASGLRYIRHDAALSTILLVMAIAGVLAFNYPALMPAFAAEELRQGAEGLGLLYAALGVGAIAGALTLAAAGHRLPRAHLFWVGAVLFCALQIVFSFTPTLPAAMGTLSVMGLFMILFTAGANTLVQMLVPDGLRGRVMGVYTLVFLGSTPIGSLLAGLVAGRLHSVPLALAGGSALSLLAISVVWWCRPTARALAASGDDDRGQPPVSGDRGAPGMIAAPHSESSRTLAAR